MGLILNLIPAPYRWILWLAIAAMIAGCGAWAGHKVTAAYYRPKVAQAQARAAEFESAYTALARATQRQNDAINQMQADAQAREEQARKAVAAAHQAAAPHHNRATAILALKPPPGTDECRAARDAFDAELKTERGKQ